jgi:HK97 family phage portal protein
VNIGGLNISWSRKATDGADALDINTVMRRLEAIYETSSGESITPENCEKSPTVKAMVTAVSRRFAVMPVHVYKKTTKNGLTVKEYQPNHPVEKLLNWPNDWQTRASYWMDAASWLMRYGNYYAYKGRGVTGPIRRLLPLQPSAVSPKQDDNWDVTYRTTLSGGRQETYTLNQIHHARLASRDGIEGASPVTDIREAIALEVAAEKFGASLFGNGAMPGLIFEYQDSNAGHKKDEDRITFQDDVQRVYGKKGRFRALLLPKGIAKPTTIDIQNDKAQFLELRQFQRTVIAGAWGCPPHLVGDLSKGTFNNVEQQDQNFTTNVILPLVRVFETAMERDLLTDSDVNSGIIIRFNPDATLRADFLQRQQGLNIQRMAGVISADEWREHEGMNPRSDGGGSTYYEQGPSGQTPANSGSQDNPDANQ